MLSTEDSTNLYGFVCYLMKIMKISLTFMLCVCYLMKIALTFMLCVLSTEDSTNINVCFPMLSTEDSAAVNAFTCYLQKITSNMHIGYSHNWMISE